MRILYVVTAAEFGGASRHVLYQMKADCERGDAVGLVAAAEPYLMGKAGQLGVTLFPNRHFVHAVQLRHDLRSLGPAMRAIRAFQPDLLSAHSTKAGYTARMLGFALRKPVVFTAHGWSFTEERNSRAKRLLVLAEWFAAKATAKLICVSERDRQLALRLKLAPAARVVTIHNGVDPTPFVSAVGAQVRTRLNLGEEPVLTMVGRLSPQKDPGALLEAASRLRGTYKLLVVGDGGLRTDLEQFTTQKGLENQVIFTGQREDIPEILAASDVFALSSRWEGLPYTVIEAMMAGLPVVATRVGGMAELVRDGVTGFLVPSNDPQHLAEAIQKLLDNPELRHRMGRAGRAKALKEFTLDRMLTETQAVYEEVMRKKRAQGKG